MKNLQNKNEFVDGKIFHNKIKNIYKGEYDWAINKRNEEMVKVVYDPAHENSKYQDDRKGKGKCFSTWVFTEEKGLEENIFATSLELLIDTTLEANASIGLHYHHDTEEIYYIIAGSITMTTVNLAGEELTQELFPGDAHLVKLGQGHYGTAGKQGVRFITFAVRKS